MSTPRRKGLLVITACVACGLLVAPAQASFHEIKIREVFPGTAANPDSAYVMLQAYSAGQVSIGGQSLYVYSSGALLTCGTPPGYTAPNGQSQMTIVFGDTAVAADIQCSNLNVLPLAAGATVCWPGAQPVDCVAWGNDTTSVGSPVGAPAPAIPDGLALRRSIAGGCPTLLEAGDDTNNSAADFEQTTPTPRNNATAPTETGCPGDTASPNTKIKKRPKNRSDDDSPTFKFRSDELGSKFKCKLDKKPFRGCKSPKTYHGLDPGAHTFKVKAIDAAGNIDTSPAKDAFKVLP
jgi:hypothetical protein